MMKQVEVSQLRGEALNYAAAVALGYTNILVNFREAWGGQTYRGVWLGHAGGGMKYRFNPVRSESSRILPLIEKHIAAIGSDDLSPTRYVWHKNGIARAWDSGGSIAIAALRCIVLAHLGARHPLTAKIEVPEELL